MCGDWIGVPAYALGECIHLLGLAGGLWLAEAVVELHQQPLSEGLAGPVDASVVEHLGVLSADAHGVGDAAVQVGALALLSLQGHPAKGCATLNTTRRYIFM